MNTHPNTSSTHSDNPLLQFGRGIVAYSLIQPSHIAPAIDALLVEAESAVAIATSQTTPPTWNDLVEPLEDATERLSRAWGAVSHLNSVADTPELRAAYGAMLPKVTAFMSSLGQNLALYERFKVLRQDPSFATLSLDQQ